VVNMVSLLPQEGLKPGDRDHWPVPEGHIIVESDSAAPGWSYQDGVFNPPDPEG
jgi:hypothetical protein